MTGTPVFAMLAGLIVAAAPDRVGYNRDVRPILSDHCFACHGPDKAQRKAELRLDLRDEALAASAFVPGNLDESELVARVTATDATEIMPPPSFHKALTAEQVDVLKRWVAQGAEYQPHWAYVAPERPTIPDAALTGDARRDINPIDALIRSRLEARRLKPSPEADRRTLIRRLSLDLTGLPPTPEEVQAFVGSTEPDAYEKLVDRLISSPRYGERMAVPWLDVVRYADTVGFHGDQNQNAWPYRDYVIDSFNENKPFDRFSIEQIAGDLLPDATDTTRLATCFNRLTMMTREGGAQPKEYLAKYTADRVRTIGMAWLGSTFACAECHDHKFDPIATKDFYALGAFFADVKQWGVYADYGYTPNPDLRGYNNDYPFPPEVRVESRHLKERERLLRNRLTEAIGATGAKLAEGPKARAEFDSWRERMIEFVADHPSGWMTPDDPEVTTGEVKSRRKPAAASKNDDPAKAVKDEKEAECRIEDDGRVVFTAKGATADTIRVEPGDRHVASVRIELLPTPERDGSILRTGASGTLNVGFAIQKKGKDRPQPVAMRFADANHHGTRYSSGAEVLGVQGAWVTDAAKKTEPHVGTWVLEKPIEMAEGDALIVSIASNPAGCVAVKLSPLVPDDLAAGTWSGDLASRLRLNNGSPGVDLLGLYLRGTAWDEAAFDQMAAIEGDIRACRGGMTPVMVTEAIAPVVARVLPRGNWQDESGPVVEPALPHFLPASETLRSPGRRLTRLDLAGWLVSPENPLTARVEVNRLWKQFLGAGLSPMVDDLGAQGEAPEYPEVLDWLAVEFRESGWDVKRLVRLIVTSQTYRQSSNPTPEMLEKDPSNRWLARQVPRRLEAEFVRDNALAIAGLLSPEMGGPPSFPYQPAGYYANIQFPDRVYREDQGDRQYRRGVYTHWQRTFLHPMLANFDAPSREDCVAARTQANSPQQALTLLNDPTFVEAARALAQHLMTLGGTDEERIAQAFRQALAREPRAEEKASLLAFLDRLRDVYRARPEDEISLLRNGQAMSLAAHVPGELGAWTNLCRVLLNLHETITRY